MPTHVISANGLEADPNTGDVQIPIFKERIILTDAQVKALNATPINLIQSPGAGKIALPISYYIIFQGTAYTNIDTNAYLYLETSMGYYGALIANRASESLQGLDNLIAFDNPAPGVGMYGNVQNARYSTYFQTLMPNDNFIVDSFENKAVRFALSNPLGALTGGDSANTLSITVYYSIIDL